MENVVLWAQQCAILMVPVLAVMQDTIELTPISVVSAQRDVELVQEGL
jgi:hypothetical protein